MLIVEKYSLTFVCGGFFSWEQILQSNHWCEIPQNIRLQLRNYAHINIQGLDIRLSFQRKPHLTSYSYHIAVCVHIQCFPHFLTALTFSETSLGAHYQTINLPSHQFTDTSESPTWYAPLENESGTTVWSSRRYGDNLRCSRTFANAVEIFR